ncbi:hypothetical protein HII31_12222 [Pseudocercospora fuligena]|uniref:BTB domain-containing protein n=1 Tax=Pseudocercospora fuligena TaxID=685502 RepID=A0A8H6RAD8_9PEZI|nr:hypothetical protein HII31_12222 [Pseudocercospora fuligena]
MDSPMSVNHGDDHDSGMVTNIDSAGDLVLDISHETASTKSTHQYRVKLSSLRTNSHYFASLLAGRFGEGEKIAQEQAQLNEKYGSVAKAPTTELPVVHIKDVGRISAVKSIEALCLDLLVVLHGKDTSGIPPVANLANLAIVADRFDALDAVRKYVQRKKIFRTIDSKTTPKADQSLSEEKVRQRLLASLLLDYPPWVEKYSMRLVTKGWVGKEADENTALWWDLPSRLEEELAIRREYILDTIQSTLARFFALYTSRERQCRLGYDSSAACDSYQLGEMVRFFARIGTLRIQGTVFDTAEPPEPYAGDIFALIESMRQVSEYQIDKFHSHCGFRTRLLPILDVVTDALQYTGICADCWSQNRVEHAWTDAKRPLLWKRQSYRTRGLGHKEHHAQIKALFMASEREWA